MGSVRSAASRLRGLSGNAEVREWIGWAADELSNNAERIADLEAEQQLSRESLSVLSRKVDGLEGELARVTAERDTLQRQLADHQRATGMLSDGFEALEKRAEQAEAQVAALVEALQGVFTEDEREEDGLLPEWEKVHQALANLPAAAAQREARRDAAERFAEVVRERLYGYFPAEVQQAFDAWERLRATAPAEVTDHG